MKKPKIGPTFERLLKEDNVNLITALTSSNYLEIRVAVNLANDRCWNWEECGYRKPAGMTQNQFWFMVKMARKQGMSSTPLRSLHGKCFTFNRPASCQRILHRIDKNLAGAIESSFPQLDEKADRVRYLVTSLENEAIASSQLEGAVVTREIAKEMLKNNRPPRTLDERMIANNYATIRMVKDRIEEPLTPEFLREIQASLTEGTIDKPDACGRFRHPEENVTVWDDEEQVPLHVPPPAETLPERIAELCRFANADSETLTAGEFIHPVIRAIILHFWIGFDHPFYDGNGRTARAIFYWSMLRSGYWLTEYLTISTIIREEPKKYARAYLNSELDENDLTYFILYHLEVIDRSIDKFQEYLDRKLAERKRANSIAGAAKYNARQQAVLMKALGDPSTRFNYTAHASSQGVSIPTARTDLLELESAGLLRGYRGGRMFEFVAVPDLEKRLR